MQASAGARKYAGEAFLRHQILAALEAYPNIPIVMHQDHGQSLPICMAAIRSGFSSVMMDGSLESDGKTVASYEYNVATTKKIVEIAHSIGVSVEGELGVLGSLETMKGDKEAEAKFKAKAETLQKLVETRKWRLYLAHHRFRQNPYQF